MKLFGKSNSEEKLTDKAFMRLAITSIAGILICIACLCSSTYAWFSDSTPSGTNEIKSSQCTLTVSVNTENANIIESEKKEFTLELVRGDSYTVTLELPAGSASGYCIIKVGENSYYTEYIPKNEGDVSKFLTFTLTVGENSVTAVSETEDFEVTAEPIDTDLADETADTSALTESVDTSAHETEETDTTAPETEKETVQVVFTPRWGIYSGTASVNNGGELIIS